MAENTIGPYQILDQLGAGGMGEVFKALDTRVGRQVALKILPESLAQDAERRRRFEQEARLAASLNHPNVMAIYDVGLDHHPPYIVSELVPGESLRMLVGKGPVPVRKAVDIAAQIASGLAAAHSAGIVHRDLKPENVIVTPDGIAKILDFGVARLDSRTASTGNATVTLAQTAIGSVVGTAAYMSPEQARAQDVDYRSDQFSLGLVLYEMLTGRQAFERPSAVQTMAAIVEDDPPPIERTLPPQLRWIMQRCLAKEREGRYESTRDLARDLAQLRDHYGELSGSNTSDAQPAVALAAAPARQFPLWPVAACVLAAAGAWCAAQWLRDPRAVELSRYRLTPFATALMEQTWPAWSPDGKSVGFIGVPESGPARIYVQTLEAPTAVAITGDGVVPYSPYPLFWSADSHSVYFRCRTKDVEGLCRAPAGGGETVMVQPRVLCASLSPDGRTLAMLSMPPDDPFHLRLLTASPPEAQPRPYQPQPFPSNAFFNNPAIAFAPDGKKILVAIGLEGRGELVYLAPWPAGPARPVFPKGLPFSFTPQLSWMPDSRYAVFSDSTADRHSEIFMTDIESGAWWPIVVQDRPAGAPTVSPDGTRMAYVSRLSHADVIAVPLGDGPVRTLLGSSRTEQMADASPAGPQLVYVTDRRGVQEVWITSLAEGWERPLFTPDAVQVDGVRAQLFMGPVFSPDGKRVAVTAQVGPMLHIFTAFVSGGAAVRATSDTASFEGTPTWSPDGNWLAYTRLVNNTVKLSKVSPGSGNTPVDLATVSSDPVPSWSPAGDWIAARDEHFKLSLFSPNGQAPRHLPGDRGAFAWSHDGKLLYQVRRDPPALWEIQIASGHDKKLRDLPGLAPFSSLNPGTHASLTADGKNIVYTVNRPRQEIWILDGLQTPRPWARLLGK